MALTLARLEISFLIAQGQEMLETNVLTVVLNALIVGQTSEKQAGKKQFSNDILA